MSTYTQILYQIVFSTKNRQATLNHKENRDELFSFIAGVIKNNKSHVYQIGGVEDHLHIVMSLHPSVALSDLIHDIKLSSTHLIKAKKLFQNFRGWQNGFGAFTYDPSAKSNLVMYVRNQEEHHKKEDFLEEYKRFLVSFDIDFDDRYLL